MWMGVRRWSDNVIRFFLYFKGLFKGILGIFNSIFGRIWPISTQNRREKNNAFRKLFLKIYIKKMLIRVVGSGGSANVDNN